MKILPVRVQLLHRTDMTKTVAFRNLAKAPNKELQANS